MTPRSFPPVSPSAIRGRPPPARRHRRCTGGKARPCHHVRDHKIGPAISASASSPRCGFLMDSTETSRGWESGGWGPTGLAGVAMMMGSRLVSASPAAPRFLRRSTRAIPGLARPSRGRRRRLLGKNLTKVIRAVNRSIRNPCRSTIQPTAWGSPEAELPARRDIHGNQHDLEAMSVIPGSTISS